MSSPSQKANLADRIETAIKSAANTGVHPRKVFAGMPEDWTLVLAALRGQQDGPLDREAVIDECAVVADECCKMGGNKVRSIKNNVAPQASPSVAPADSEFGSAVGPAGAALSRAERFAMDCEGYATPQSAGADDEGDWQCEDPLADGWITFPSRKAAEHYQKKTGVLMRYRRIYPASNATLDGGKNG